MKRPSSFVRLPVPHLILGLLLFVLAACDSPRSTSPPAYVYVVDYSGSTANMRRQALGEILEEVESAPDGTNIVIFRMAFDTEEVFSGRLDESTTDAIAAVMHHDLLSSDVKKGTNFASMAESLASFAKGFSGESFAVRIYTDGGDDFAGDHRFAARYKAAAAELSDDKRLRPITFYGVLPEYRANVRTAFATAGPKLSILGFGQGLTVNDSAGEG